MLVLSRKVNEAVVIGQDVRVTVLGIDGDRVRIGIDAPNSLRIFRHELLSETTSFNRESASAPLVIFNLKKQLEQDAKEDDGE